MIIIVDLYCQFFHSVLYYSIYKVCKHGLLKPVCIWASFLFPSWEGLWAFRKFDLAVSLTPNSLVPPALWASLLPVSTGDSRWGPPKGPLPSFSAGTWKKGDEETSPLQPWPPTTIDWAAWYILFKISILFE